MESVGDLKEKLETARRIGVRALLEDRSVAQDVHLNKTTVFCLTAGLWTQYLVACAGILGFC